MDMIFGEFLEINVRLLKNIISQFFSKQSKSYKIKCQRLVKSQRPLTKKRVPLTRSNYMYLTELYKSLS